MVELLEAVAAAIGADHVSSGSSISDDYAHDEALTVPAVVPALVARPGTTTEVAAFDWSSDPAPYLDTWFIFGRAEASLGEVTSTAE